MKLSAKQAAKQVGKSTPTITRAIKSGKLSAIKNDNGGYEIDPAELFRVYPAIKSKESNATGNVTPKMLPYETPNVTSHLKLEVKFLNEKIEDKEKRLSDKDSVISDLQTRLDKESEERQKLTLLITDQRDKKEKAPETNNNLLPWLIPPVFLMAFAAAIIAAQSF